MDETQAPPLVFANRVIRQYVDHGVGAEAILLPQDYYVIRLVFRWCGGSWERLELGDIVHNRLLSRIIAAWGNTSKHKRDVARI